MSKKRAIRRRKRTDEERDVFAPNIRPRFQAACAIVAKKYCDAFRFWRDCRYKPCRSARRCMGDLRSCLETRQRNVPDEERLAATLRIVAETPTNADWPTHEPQRQPVGFFTT